ncbi:MAG: hypothetical protein PHD25_12045 [Bacteroidales bacterium]|nr:hypothetical protein [Bacteroidales bacterium]
MKKISLLSLIAVLVLFALNGCLTVETKEYTFELTGPNSGKLTIRYINILSTMDDSVDVSADDFEELLSNYLYGESFETDYPDAVNFEKQLYEENGVLCGRITMEFTDLSAVKLFRYKSSGPYMLNIGSFLDTETFIEANGDFGGDTMPVVFWSEDARVLTLKTGVAQPDETTLSLLDDYLEWKEKK